MGLFMQPQEAKFISSNKHETGLACSVLSQLVSRSELL